MAKIKTSWWAMHAAKIDVAAPPGVNGNEMMIAECAKGISAKLY